MPLRKPFLIAKNVHEVMTENSVWLAQLTISIHRNSGKIHLSKLSIQNYSAKKIFIFEGDQQKFQCNIILARQMQKTA